MTRANFTRLAEEYKDMIFRIALNYCANSQDADDVVQEVLLRFYLSKKDFQNDEHVRNWLIRTAINQSKNVLRHRKRHPCMALEDADEPVQFQFPEQSALYHEVMALPEKYRTALYLFYYEELSTREIAQILRTSTTTVTTRLSRAREQLKINLTGVLKHGE